MRIVLAAALVAAAIVVFALSPHKTVVSFAAPTTTTTTWPGYGEGTLCGANCTPVVYSHGPCQEAEPAALVDMHTIAAAVAAYESMQGPAPTPTISQLVGHYLKVWPSACSADAITMGAP
jgi:hypothetical protein